MAPRGRPLGPNLLPPGSQRRRLRLQRFRLPLTSAPSSAFPLTEQKHLQNVCSQTLSNPTTWKGEAGDWNGLKKQETINVNNRMILEIIAIARQGPCFDPCERLYARDFHSTLTIRVSPLGVFRQLPLSQMSNILSRASSVRRRRKWQSLRASRSAVSNSGRPYGQAPLSVGSPGKNPGVGCQALLQGIFPTHGSNPRLLRLLHCS